MSKTTALKEGSFSDGCDGIADADICQTRATIESTHTDSDDGAWNGDDDETGALKESIIADGCNEIGMSVVGHHRWDVQRTHRQHFARGDGDGVAIWVDVIIQRLACCGHRTEIIGPRHTGGREQEDDECKESFHRVLHCRMKVKS